MDITKEQLADRYSKMDENSLIELYMQGSLTTQAEEVIQSELKSRGLSLDKAELLENYEEPAQPVPASQKVAKSTRGCLVTALMYLIVIGIINLFVFGFGKLIAPIIWSSPIDRQCQDEGYWYGKETSNPEEIECVSYWVR
ncbi:MAG: hypothetical protein JXA04_06055 [Gammaproteobacteria bacterium]|nr:hypothetical protein [Gammaproteobacteria bacterium]